jgi:hypothetical protein
MVLARRVPALRASTFVEFCTGACTPPPPRLPKVMAQSGRGFGALEWVDWLGEVLVKSMLSGVPLSMAHGEGPVGAGILWFGTLVCGYRVVGIDGARGTGLGTNPWHPARDCGGRGCAGVVVIDWERA